MSLAPAVDAALETLTVIVLRTLAHGADPDASAVRFLLRRYAATGRDDVLRALESALTWSVESWSQSPHKDLPGWLTLFAEAAAVSDDERLRSSSVALSSALLSTGSRTSIGDVAARVDACLRACAAGIADASLQAAIDELERLVGAHYEPGEGLSRSVAGGRPLLADHVSTASALLTGYELTGRLPYSMLAEELMRFAGRVFRNAGHPGFADDVPAERLFAVNCEAALVLLRLGALHESDDYRQAAVVAPDADYGRDAAAMLSWLAPEAVESGFRGAIFGIVASDWQSVL